MSKEQRKTNPPQPDTLEKRVFTIEMRAAADGDGVSSLEGGKGGENRTVTGYAAVFNSPSEDMGFIEYIEPGAFREAIPKSDVRALFNHDPNYILARTASGTLKIEEDERGLRYQFSIPETTFGNDFAVMLQRGDVSQSSFSFTVKDQTWEENRQADGTMQYTRRIKKVERLYDVSPVTYPAYPDTEVALRSIGEMQKETPPITDNQSTNHQTDPRFDLLQRKLKKYAHLSPLEGGAGG